MHFVTPEFPSPYAYLDEFLNGKQSVRRLNSSEAEFTRGRLPEVTEIVVLQYAL